MGAFPGSLSEGAAERSEAEGVYPDARNRSKISEPIKTVRKPSARWNHRTTLPQRGSREGLHHSTGYSLKSQVSGDFHRPYATLMILAYTIHRTTLPQSALRADSSLREGAGNGPYHSTYRPGTPTLAGDFHRPYEGSECFTFLHSSDDTPSVSLSLDSSLREGAGEGCVPLNRPPGNPNVGGRFSSPLRRAGGIQPAAREPQRWRAIFIAPTKGCAIQPTMVPMAQVRDRRRGWWSR